MRAQQKPFVVEIRRSRRRKEASPSQQEGGIRALTVTHATKQEYPKDPRLNGRA